ncbi:hypothetical protein QL285_080795 [Trifolium repens]|jgi:hypothetical protein|nr:hypothetical protein QL285_080795 [Trifolium repens]
MFLFFPSIWHHRNDVVWNDSPNLPNQIGRIAYDVWNDWFVVHHLKNEENYNFVPPTFGRWKKPHIGWVKCNIDAAVFVEARVTMMRSCFRDMLVI